MTTNAAPATTLTAAQIDALYLDRDRRGTVNTGVRIPFTNDTRSIVTDAISHTTDVAYFVVESTGTGTPRYSVAAIELTEGRDRSDVERLGEDFRTLEQAIALRDQYVAFSARQAAAAAR